jgi:hypothetical protein
MCGGATHMASAGYTMVVTSVAFHGFGGFGAFRTLVPAGTRPGPGEVSPCST